MNIFYTPEISGNIITLSEEESAHCARVLRMRSGDKVLITNGHGLMCEARILASHHKASTVEITHSTRQVSPRNYYLHMAVAPTKNIDRFEWFIEKACEIGIDEITPIVTEHSERKIIKPERIENILISAMKQSKSAWLPVLNPIIPYGVFMKNIPTQSLNLIAHCMPSAHTKLKDIYTPKQKVCIMIGPEGDFSTKEIELAQKLQFTEITLGQARLRTETAALVACHSISFLNMI